jgi:hypothetical protein
MATGRDPVQQLPVHTELIDIAVARSRHIVVLFCVLFGKRNEDIAIQNLDTEGRKPVLDVWIGEAVHLLKGAVEHVNRTIAEVRRVKEGSVGIGADRETLVHGASAAMGIVDGENRAGAAVHTGVPARNGAVLGREDETRGSGYALVILKPVPAMLNTSPVGDAGVVWPGGVAIVIDE